MTNNTSTSIAHTSDRLPNGKFAPGHAGGPGRPKRAVEQDYLLALTDGVSLAAWAKIVARAVADATKGDAKAREWLARYLIGDRKMEVQPPQEALQHVKVLINMPPELPQYPTLNVARVGRESEA